MGSRSRKICACVSVVMLLRMLVRIDAGASTDNCQRKCAGMDIPYPFGLDNGPGNCYREYWSFSLTCNHSFTPAKLFQGELEVFSISVPDAKMGILLDMSYDCYGKNPDDSIWNISLADAYTFSDKENVFTGVGCDTLAQIEGPKDQRFTGGCLSVCYKSSNIIDGECSGIGCCQAAVPKGLQRYATSFGDGHNHSSVLNFNPCSYSFLVQKGNYTFRRSDLRNMNKSMTFPVVLDWSIIDSDSCQEAVKNKTSYACISSNSECANSSSGVGYICNCSPGYRGNPYVVDGCRDIDECKDLNTYPCNGTCVNLPGSYNCTCPADFTGDPRKSGCQRLSASPAFPTAILVPVLVASILLTVGLSIWVYSLLQKRKVNKLKERCFIQNGGKLLQRRIMDSGENEENFKIFSMEEIEKATNKYDQDLIIGRGGQGVVYKGTLPNDSRTFAVKKSFSVVGSRIDEYINELVILSKVNHRNIVKLIGCCLEVEDPLLVYEYVENGTLSKHISYGSLPWDIRLKIAAETAGALAYLHSSTNTPIIHRDVKSSNILLDKQYIAKVSDFGASKLVPIEKTEIHTVVMGTLGYLDPEYLLTHQLTEKSDVYSFGVVLVELLTGKIPISNEKIDVERCLATYFTSCMKSNKLEQILDSRVLNTDVVSEMREVAMLANHCLNMMGENRPQMVEVAMELEGLRRKKKHPWSQQNNEEIESLLGEPSIDNHDEKVLLGVEEIGTSITQKQISAFYIENGR